MPTILIVETVPLSVLSDFSMFAGIPVRRVPESSPFVFSAEQLAAWSKPPARGAAEPIAEAPISEASRDLLASAINNQRRRMDEIERQLGRVIDQVHSLAIELRTCLAQADAHSKHLANHDVHYSTLSRQLGGVAGTIHQISQQLAQTKAAAAACVPGNYPTSATVIPTAPSAPAAGAPKPSANGKPHNEQCPGHGPLDLENH